mmetsp:Transcript_2526/g.2887  ORF Transcript_2526/g.2887 Transcript_2526/m.2887 type:complete len:137 (+) Transcript_2526:91-501(+)
MKSILKILTFCAGCYYLATESFVVTSFQFRSNPPLASTSITTSWRYHHRQESLRLLSSSNDDEDKSLPSPPESGVDDDDETNRVEVATSAFVGQTAQYDDDDKNNFVLYAGAVLAGLTFSFYLLYVELTQSGLLND